MTHHDQRLDAWLSSLRNLFDVTLSNAREIITCFHEEMKQGLAGEKSSLTMIPSFTGRPRGTERGRFLALDLGGSNIRVLSVTLDGKGRAKTERVSRFAVPPEIMKGSGEALFDFIADSVGVFFRRHAFDPSDEHDLAFTFSFPVAQTGVASGKLLTWTKGFTASGVEGRDVVYLLAEALKRKKMEAVRVTALVNDTVGTLAAGSYADPACDMGVILGTGTNACYPERLKRIRKIQEFGSAGEMIINMEWGNFNGIRRNTFDQQLDRASWNPGRQAMEKMVSGMYLGELARRVIMEAGDRGLLLQGKDRSALSREYVLTAEHLAKTEEGVDFLSDFGIKDVTDRDRNTAEEICRIISRRASRIAGAAIAAVLTWMDTELDGEHTVAVDGSLFEKYPGFKENTIKVIGELFGVKAKKVRLRPTTDGSGIGAAVIAATNVAFPSR